MQHLFGALTRNFRLIRLRKFRGQQPAGPEGDGETRVASAKCLMSLDGHLLRPGGTSPPSFSFTRFIVEQCLLKKTIIWPLLTVLKLPGHHIVLNTADTRHTLMPWRIPFFPRTIPHWNSLSPSVANNQSTEEFRALLFKQKFSQKFLCFFCCFVFCVLFVFLFYQNFQIRTPWCNAQVWAKPVKIERKKERKVMLHTKHQGFNLSLVVSEKKIVSCFS